MELPQVWTPVAYQTRDEPGVWVEADTTPIPYAEAMKMHTAGLLLKAQRRVDATTMALVVKQAAPFKGRFR